MKTWTLKKRKQTTMKPRQLKRKVQKTVDVELNEGIRQYLKTMGDDIGQNEFMKNEMIQDWKDYAKRMNIIQKLIEIDEDLFEKELNKALMNII